MSWVGAPILGVTALISVVSCRTPHHPAQHASEAHEVASSGTRSSGSGDATRRRLRLVARADQALSERWPLDYTRPFVHEPYDAKLVRELYAEACHAGDKRSCWMAAAVESWGYWGNTHEVVLANCLAGDTLSCRALPYDPVMMYWDAPGIAGRSYNCHSPRQGSPCNTISLRQECAKGFALSCAVMRFNLPSSSPERDNYNTRAKMLSREGCRLGLTNECDVLRLRTGDDADLAFAYERMCIYELFRCAQASDAYRKMGDLIRARDFMERNCQYGPAEQSCLSLGLEYVNGTLEEPVEGRGKALIEWACADPAMQKHAPRCKPAAANQARPAPSSP